MKLLQWRTARHLGLLLLVFCIPVLLSGCRNQELLMPTPIIYTSEGIDPFADASQHTNTYEIIVATDRQRSGFEEPDQFYTNRRGRSLRFGVSRVQIGSEESTPQELNELSRQEDRQTDLIVNLIDTQDLGPLSTTLPPDISPDDDPPADTIIAEMINSRLADAEHRDIYIFVHGYNTRFDRNVELGAEILHFMGRNGVVISYGWPSRDAILGYGTDKANAAWSVRHFRFLVEYLAKHTTADRINIIGHSAGCPIIVNALMQIRLKHHNLSASEAHRITRIGSVLLAAPDMDLLEFMNCKRDGFTDLAEMVGIYMSRKDRALGLSAWVYKYARLGRSLDSMNLTQRAELFTDSAIWAVDVTKPQTMAYSFLGHSYFHRNAWISADMIMFIHYNLLPAERGLIRKEGDFAWQFPDDYPVVIRSIAHEMVEE